MGQQTRQKKQLSSKPKPKIQIILALLLLIFVAVGSLLLYHHHTQQLAIDKERSQFAQTEKDLDELATSIVTNFGQPDDHLKSSSCAYASRDFGKGPLGCSVNDYLVYSAQSPTEAILLASKIQDFTRNSSYLRYASHTSGTSNTAPPLDLGGEDYTDSKTTLKCTTGYTYSEDFHALELEGYPKLKANNAGLLLDITCGGPAKSPYYTLDN